MISDKIVIPNLEGQKRFLQRTFFNEKESTNGYPDIYFYAAIFGLGYGIIIAVLQRRKRDLIKGVRSGQ
jgi:hypothetical protein